LSQAAVLLDRRRDQALQLLACAGVGARDLFRAGRALGLLDLVHQARVGSEVGVDAVTLTQVDAVGPVAQKAVQAGIPVVGFNGGITDYAKFNIPMYFGSDEDVAGQAVGQRLTQAGSTGRALCVITEQGSAALEARCAGVKRTYADTEVIYVNGTDLPSVQATLGAKLQQDPSISTIVALGAPFALAAIQPRPRREARPRSSRSTSTPISSRR
jgi:ABC-type sugar transport system substrate-binding protein